MASRTMRGEARAEGEAWARVSSRAELLRLGAVTALVGMMVGFVAARAPLVAEGVRLAWLAVSVFAGLLVHAGLSAWLVRRAGRRGEMSAWWARWWGVAFESALPTLVMLIYVRVGERGAEDTLRSGGVLQYLLLLVLSPLRLRAGESVAAGLIGGAGYSWVVWRTHAERASAGIGIEDAMLYTTAVWIVVAGFAAACVAWALRRSVVRVMQEGRARAAAEREISAAAEVQRGLLPSESPSVAGYSFAFWSRPAEKAGGDYYDWQSVGDGRVVVSLADVTGHGLGPALMAAFCRAYARASMGGAVGLSEAMRKVNALLMADLPAGRFVTFAGALVSAGDELVRVVSAGHGPIFVRRADGTMESHMPQAAPLGVVEEEAFDEVLDVRLASGDSLILLTDGFFEWPGEDGTMFGLSRLRDALSRVVGDGDDMIASVRDEVESHARSVAQPDDLTMVVVRRK